MSLYKKEHPEYLRVALDSMINQTIKPDEIVLVEDGPLTDELYAVVDEYKSYLTIVVNEKNLGLGLALNKGLETCRNDLVARMDTDDISVCNRCEKQLIYFSEHTDTTILGGQIEEFVTDTNDVIGKRVVPEMDEKLKLYMKKRCPFNHVTVMFKKTDIIKVGNYQDWFWNEDYYLWIRLALEGYKFANLSDTLVHTRVSAEMYQRRGGWQYFRSEKLLQQYMLRHKLISIPQYIYNICIRFGGEVLASNSMRQVLYKAMRKKHNSKFFPI